MIALLRSVRTGLIAVSCALSALAMMCLFLLVALNAFWRYLGGGSLTWGQDVAIYIMILGLMVALSWAYLTSRHVNFNLLNNLIPPNWKRAQAVLIDLTVIATGVGLLVSSWYFIQSRGSLTSSSTQLPMWLFQLSVPLGSVLLTIAALVMLGLRFDDSTNEQEDDS